MQQLLADRRHEAGPPSPLFGVAEGRNLIVVMVESLQAFPIGLGTEGGPVAPALESLASESLSFVRFYDQTHMGTTADAELAAFQSLHPLPAGAIATRYPANSFRALPAILADRRYRTLSIVGADGDAWNMRHVHPRLGFERSLFAEAFPGLERFGPGVADGALLPEVASLLEQQEEPFVAYLMTMSTHHPYLLPPEHRALGLDESSIGDRYLESIHYVDRALGELVARLRESGLLDRSVLAVFGDHHGYLDRPAVLSERLGVDPDNERAQWEIERRLPFFVRLPHGRAAGPRDTPAGHLDIAPTLLALLGIPPETLPGLGRDLTREARDPMVVLRNGGFVVPEATCVRPPSRGRWPGVLRRQSPPSAFAGIPPGAGPRGEGAAAGLGSDHRGQPDPGAGGRGEGATMKGMPSVVLGVFLLALACAAPTERKPTTNAATPRPGFVVIGHRGNPVAAPENTLRSIESAFAVGANVVEVDVRLTRDGVPVLFHDDVLERTTLGSGTVEETSLEELRKLRALSRFDETARDPIPTLEEALLLARDRGRLFLDINADGMAPVIAALLDRLEIPQTILEVATWSEAQAAEYLAHLPGAAVIGMGLPEGWRDGALEAARERGLAGYDIGGDVPLEFVDAAHEADLRVYTYTINDGEGMRRLIARGVDGIETDVPELLATVVREMGGQGFTSPAP